MPKGVYAIEDKGSPGAVKPEQSKVYSDILEKEGKLQMKRESDGTEVVAQGIITVLPDQASAEAVALEMGKKLHARVHVAYRGKNGNLIVVR